MLYYYVCVGWSMKCRCCCNLSQQIDHNVFRMSSIMNLNFSASILFPNTLLQHQVKYLMAMIYQIERIDTKQKFLLSVSEINHRWDDCPPSQLWRCIIIVNNKNKEHNVKDNTHIIEIVLNHVREDNRHLCRKAVYLSIASDGC